MFESYLQDIIVIGVSELNWISSYSILLFNLEKNGDIGFYFKFGSHKTKLNIINEFILGVIFKRLGPYPWLFKNS